MFLFPLLVEAIYRELEMQQRLASNAKILLQQAAERENDLIEQRDSLLKKVS